MFITKLKSPILILTLIHPLFNCTFYLTVHYSLSVQTTAVTDHFWQVGLLNLKWVHVPHKSFWLCVELSSHFCIGVNFPLLAEAGRWCVDCMWAVMKCALAILVSAMKSLHCTNVFDHCMHRFQLHLGKCSMNGWRLFIFSRSQEASCWSNTSTTSV